MARPAATYRLQLRREFTMQDAAALADYFAGLGVSHLYLSPILQSTPGSPHGYDGVDPQRIDADRGGEAGFEALRAACGGSGLGMVLDIVPNHLDVSSLENRWWRSVLETGESSPYAAFFDIDWDEANANEEDQGVVVPVLGERLPDALESGDIRLAYDDGSIMARYFDHTFPISPATAAELVRTAASQAPGEAAQRLSGAAETFESVAAMVEAERPQGWAGALDHAKQRLREAVADDDGGAAALEGALRRASNDADVMERVLAAQNYQLIFWRRAARSLNYRRFFNINTLVGVRVEAPDVFEAVHKCALELATLDEVDGLRVDHPDGLRDPNVYFRALRRRAPTAWLLAEKILEPGEPLRRDWPIDGTTGYDFLNSALGALVDPAAEAPLTAFYEEFTGAAADYEDVEFEAKWTAARRLLAADLARLVRIVRRLDGAGWFERAELADAVALLAACFPVYRTYVAPERGEISAEDRRIIEEAAARATRRRPEIAGAALEFIQRLLTLERTPPDGAERPAPEDEFVARFQQYSAPVTAKGVEDTAFYRYHRFIALNEVGGTPHRFGLRIDDFHSENAQRCADWPATMLATSTHDTKRSEDVRARLAALSETPREWADAVRSWANMNDPIRTRGDERVDRKTEYLLYQTLVGAWPIDADRAVAFMMKAAKEAKERTSWVDPHEGYESSLQAFVRAALDHEPFVRSLEAFVGWILRPGRINSLTQALLKFTAPGVPDLYQGCELWDLSLVDPDNRRPVDFALRRRLLSQLDSASVEEIWATLDDAADAGLCKLFLTTTALNARRERTEAFAPGSGYEPLSARGEHRGRVVAFARLDPTGAARAVTIAPRLTAGLTSWSDTAVVLPRGAAAGAWVNRLSGERIADATVALSDLFRTAPLALLTEGAS